MQVAAGSRVHVIMGIWEGRLHRGPVQWSLEYYGCAGTNVPQAITTKQENRTEVDIVSPKWWSAMDHGSGTAAALRGGEKMYWRLSKTCFARLKMVNKLGFCLDTKGERSLNPLRDSRIWENFTTTSSIKGRFAGLTWVISSTRSCINSKPWYF